MSSETLKILHIDDDADEHAYLGALLREAQTVTYEVAWAETAAEGWRLLQERAHDAYLIDSTLASESGMELIRRAHAQGLVLGPMILLTDAGDAPLDIAALAAGAADYLEKDSLTAVTLDRAIRHAVQRQRIMEELRDKEVRLSLALSAANLGFWDWNAATDELYLTPEYKRMLGYEAHEAVFSSFSQWRAAIHPDDFGFVERVIQRLMDGAMTSAHAFYRLRDKSGEYRWIQDRTVAVHDGQRLVRLFGIGLDMTERKIVEERLREQTAALDQANDAIIVRDLDHRVVYCNASAVRLLGLPSEKIVGRTAAELGVFTSQYHEASAQVLQQGDWQGELTIHRQDGIELLTEGRWTLLHDDAGRPKAVLAFYIDITERKRLETQYLRAQRMESIGLLAGGIAHDLNNVLAPIVMATQLLKLRHPDADSQKLLSTVETSAQRGAELIRQVLTFARGMEGQRLLVQPKALVRDIEKLLTETVDKSIAVVIEFEPDLWPVPGDPTQLHQVLMNLCINARDAMPQGGRLTLRVRNVRIDEQYAAMSPELHPGLYVLFEVQDTGVGIPPEIRERIFEPFFSTKAPGKGTGLGLSTARTIVNHHDGFISLSSEKGRGTTFSVYLPACTEVAATGSPSASAPPLRGNGETILIVDDEASILSITGHALEAYGYQVITASNGAEALAIFAQKRSQIAAVLTDMAMPVLDGAALIYALRKIDPEVKIIAASGLKSDTRSMNPFGLDATRFLAKPFTAETMLQAIHEALAAKSPEAAPAAVLSPPSRPPG